MPLPKYIRQRRDTYYVRRALPLDVRAAFGREEIWISLRTTNRKEAEARSHAAIAEITDGIEAKRRELRAAAEEAEYLASDRFGAALADHASAVRFLDGSGPGFAWHPANPEEAALVAQGIELGVLRPRPASKAEAAELLEHDLAEIDAAEARVSLVRSVAADGEPDLGNLPPEFRSPVQEFINELFEAKRRSVEASHALRNAAEGRAGAGEPTERQSLSWLAELWNAQCDAALSSQADMRTAIKRFERVNGPLPFADVAVEHARMLKANLLADTKLANSTRKKLWGMLRALFGAAVDDSLLGTNPFAQVKIRLDDDSARRETLTRADLAALFDGVKDKEEWWLFRLGLYTGARLGELCQLTKSDLVTIEGVHFLHIREDAEAGKRVKNRGSVRKVPLHRQLVADGVLEWIASRPGDALFTVGSAAASKRLNRRMRATGLGEGKVFHSLRHTFKTAARSCMDSSWHDRLTGHAHRTVGETYGDYDPATMKRKMDMISFGLETQADA